MKQKWFIVRQCLEKMTSTFLNKRLVFYFSGYADNLMYDVYLFNYFAIYYVYAKF